MHYRAAAKVGFVVVLAIAAFLFVYYAILKVGSRAQGYMIYATFRDTQNLEVGGDVRLAGVPIGVVSEISLTDDNRAMVGMRIERRYHVPQGSRFLITAGGLIGQQYVAIVPPTARRKPLRENAVVRGYDARGIEDLIASAGEFTDISNRIARRLEGLTASLNSLLQDRNLNRQLREVASNLAATSARSTRLIDELRATNAAASPRLQRMLASADSTMQRFGDTADAITELLTGTGGQLKGDLGRLIRTFNQTAQRLDATVANLQTLTSDPRWGADLAELVDNLKAGSVNARDALASLKSAAQSTQAAAAAFQDTSEVVNARVVRLLGRPKPKDTSGTPSGPSKPPAVPTATSLDVYQVMRPGQVRVDLNQTLALGGNSFAYLGLRNIGESTRVNLQLGHSANDRLSYRYGLYDSRLGVGADYNLGRGFGFTANLYRPDEPTLDLYARKRFSEKVTGVLGVERLFDRNRAVLGIRYRP